MSTPRLTPVILLLLGGMSAVSAQTISVQDDAGQDDCQQISCLAGNPFAGDQGSSFGALGPTALNEPQTSHRPAFGPTPVPPGGKPEVIHTGSGKELVPGPRVDGGLPSPSFAVPLPGALGLLLVGVAVLGVLGRGGRRT